MMQMPISESDLAARARQWRTDNAQRLTAPSDADASTLSRLPVEAVYTAADTPVPGTQDGDQFPGAFPYTRGILPGMYREQLWVMGQYSGHGSARQTNARIRSLLAGGQRGFSVALDLPTQMGLDSDDPRAKGEVGRVGVPIDSVADMVELLDGIALDQVRQIRTTANAIGPLAVALFAVAAERLGYRPDQFKVMLQNDILKEYVARGTYIFPPRKGLRFSVDVIEYCARNLPRWEPIEFCGYHIRDSGSDAVQELAIAMANGFTYIEEALGRGLSIDDFGGSLYMFLSAHLDIFEEVAKFRTARGLWARLMRERYNAADEACRLNIFCYTLGSPQTAQEPLNNIVRIAYQALAAILGGVQTLATSAYDEAIQLPSDEAARVSLRTQQILAHETGVVKTADPLAGSYYLEALTAELTGRVTEMLDEIDAMGGSLRALETGWIGKVIDDESYRQQTAVDSGERVVVGVNRYASEQAELRHRLTTDPRLEIEQVQRLSRLREHRDNDHVHAALAELRRAAADGENTVPHLMEAVRREATVGEICSALREVWGVYVA
ncbi:acyl-CoA mutase large subunit family protein [Wenjunlia tyrosinilytica]|uniref:Methylmalonyl-CoA mutase n=1 Tax=Wenjunlia tyrosinilytica TaxID=1544741 RepID=A0A917ZW46_9ACTN|nr:methylmalonyl-CoA mutase family protein [Wenjunlia tyrosinilytica]GGO97200.1 methylmalonyl-CoA mutase [Wenjunlia tyrosinilytica]